MCLVIFSYKSHPEYPLILASNRDEFYDRPTAPASFWEDVPDLLAGRDLKECGTWLGITKSGRFATITNYRDPRSLKNDAPSRGELVSSFLRNHMEPLDYIEEVRQKAGTYNGFNLLFGYVSDLYYFSNRGDGLRRLTSGLYGLSNHLLDTPWSKVTRGKKSLGEVIDSGNSLSPDAIFGILSDGFRPDDALLPDTGVGLTWERILSPVFVESPVYGTRFSTVVLVDRRNNVTLVERAFRSGPDRYEEQRFEFPLSAGDIG